MVTLVRIDAESLGAGSPSRPATALLAELNRLLAGAQALVRDARPESASGHEAALVVEGFARLQRVATSGVALFTPVVTETGAYATRGHGSAADWLAAASGSSAGSAKQLLVAAQGAALTPVLTEALHDGGLSIDQLKVVTTTVSEVKGSAGDLLGRIEQGASHQELSEAAEQIKAAARSKESERARRDRVQANRHLRWHQDQDGGIRLEGLCDEVAWAKIAPALEAAAKERWKAAGKHGGSLEAHRLDAFIDLWGSSNGSSGRSRPVSSAAPRAVVIIDAEALRRGTTNGDELCEIEGVGPVSVAAATELLGEGGLQYVIKEGVDITTVTRSTRSVTQCIDIALLVRDRVCAVPGCGKRLGLERDHWQLDYGKDGPTELANLVRLCPAHHHMKTNGGWALQGGPGHWRWVAPNDPPSAGRMARQRKVAVAKAQAGVTGDRNRPRRT